MKYYSLLLLSILLWIPFHAEAQEKDSITFAVMGNSISTYYGYIPDGYKVFYTEDREKKYGIQVGDTWWMQLSRLSGLTFLANAGIASRSSSVSVGRPSMKYSFTPVWPLEKARREDLIRSSSVIPLFITSLKR